MTTRPFELRQDGSAVRFDGYASLFKPVSYKVGPITEEIAPAAFRRSLSRPDLDVVLRVEHQGLPLARTSSGTLRLNEDDRGLRAQADLDQRDPQVQSLLVKYERGDLREMSFAFRCERDSFSDDYQTRTVLEASLHRGDVSIVTYGSSPTTTSTLSRSEMRSFASRISSSGWCGPGLVRQAPVGVMGNQGGDVSSSVDEEGWTTCPTCGSDGDGPDGVGRCPNCGGLGTVPPDGDDGDEGRSQKYSAAEKARMMAKGHALPNAKGQPSYQLDDREDIRRAVKAVGRGSRSPERIRLHIVKNAKRLGAMDLIPSSWDLLTGRLKRSASMTPGTLRYRAATARTAYLESEINQYSKHRGLSSYDKDQLVRRASRMATEARLRGDVRQARTWDRIVETEILSQAMGL